MNVQIKNNKSLLRDISSAVDEIKDEMIAFIQKLVQTPSLPAQEKDVQGIIAAKLGELKLAVDILSLDEDELVRHPAFSDDGFPIAGRVNVGGHWMGHSVQESPALILNGHVDVVSPGAEEMWDESPYSGTVKNGRIYGRGSADMKSGLSAAIFAVQVLQKIGFHPEKDLLIHSVVGEETGGCGTLTNIIKGHRADAAIIMEPTKLNIYPLHSGALSFRVKVKGKAMHACMKNKGVSAIEKFYIILKAVNDLDKERHAQYSNPIFEDPKNVAPISFGTLRSGDWPSTVPGDLVTEGRYGVFPGEPIEEAKKVFEECIDRACLSDDWLKNNLPEVEWFEGRFEPGETSLDEPVIKTLSACHRAVLGQDVKYVGATYGSDLRLFTNHAGIPAVLYGPGDVLDAHTVNESIAIDEILSAVKVLALMIMNWC